jgi:hypothetical protein
MATHVDEFVRASINAIPLLDASSLPSAEDWALLESINANSDLASDFEPDLDRFGRFRLTASFDE